MFFVCIIPFVYLALPISKDSIRSQDTIDYEVIPDEAIRLRILANSDRDEDQEVKRAVRDQVNETISAWVKNLTDVEAARQLIEAKIPTIHKIVGQTLKEHGVTDRYHVSYGENIAFPAKLYGSYLYPPGEYEAVLITIGEGQGENWWCVLFPPLCFLDFENGTTVAEASAKEDSLEEHELEEDKEEDEKEDDSLNVKFFLFDFFGWS